jgi:hypothetical protein
VQACGLVIVATRLEASGGVAGWHAKTMETKKAEGLSSASKYLKSDVSNHTSK